MDVGVRDLRDNLSRHLAHVRSGQTVTVTDHGKAVARIVPIGVPTRLEQLRAEGRVTAARRAKGTAPVAIPAPATAPPVSDLISQQRR